MRAFKSGILGFMLVALTGVTALASPETPQGGHDGGGAGVQLSSEAEVLDAIQWAMEELRKTAANERVGHDWLSLAYGGPETKTKKGEMLPVTFCLSFPLACEDVSQALQGEGPIYSSAWDYLKLSPLEIRREGKGACPAPDKREAAASVSAYKIGARLCFSVDILRKTPRDVIRAQVASILAHEMAHLMGHGEEIAVGVQEAVYGSFSAAAVEELRRVRDSVMTQLFFAKAELERIAGGVLCTNLACSNADAAAMATLGSFHGRIQAFLSVLPVGAGMKEPSLASRPELWEKATDALKAPFNRMYNLQMDILEGKSSTEQQMEQGKIALKELKLAEEILEEFLGTKRGQ